MLSIITLKKIQEGKGLERNGVKGSKGGLMEEVTLEQKSELARRRQERGQHLQENDPPEDGATSSRVYKGCLATRRFSWAERVRYAPFFSEPRGLR